MYHLILIRIPLSSSFEENKLKNFEQFFKNCAKLSIFLKVLRFFKFFHTLMDHYQIRIHYVAMDEVVADFEKITSRCPKLQRFEL